MQPTDANLRSIAKYRSKAAGYDATAGPTMPIRAECIRRLALEPGDTVLDVGCGTGLSFEPLARAVGAGAACSLSSRARRCSSRRRSERAR